MNCEEARKKISIRTVLESFNLFPVKENRKTAFYFALDREEIVPSLSVNFLKNTAFDFGTGKNYDVISIVQIINKCSVSDSLKYLERFDFSLKNDDSNSFDIVQQNYQINKVSDVKHLALIQYLDYRKVLAQKDLVKEIHYQLDGKNYFGIGFINNSGGIEIRNKYSKICLGTKDISLIKNKSNSKKEVLVFEGFFDYLTYRVMAKVNNETADFLILNSTAMLFKADNFLEQYAKIILFLDNDSNGKATKVIIENKYQNVEDCSTLYVDFKDLNDWWIEQ